MIVFRFLGAMARTLWARLRGYEVLVTPEIQEARFDICSKCPFFDPEFEMCGVCGCFLHGKTALSVEKCPKGFWASEWRKKRTTS